LDKIKTDDNTKFIKMTTEPVEKLICSLAVPTIISMLVTSFYNMADTYFVSSLGKSAVGGVGVAFPLMAVIQAFGFFFGHGSGNYIGRELGKQNIQNAEKMAATGFFTSVIFGLFVMASGLIFRTRLVYLLGATDTIAPYAREYLSVILIGAPYMTASFVLNNQLRFQGNAFYGMIGIATGAVTNLFLTPLFIFVFKLGVSGAALGTILSQLISFCLLLSGTARSGGIRIRLKNFTPNGYYLKEIAAGGTPSLLRQGLASVATTCLNISANPFGDEAIAAMSIVSRVMMFANSAVIGFGQGFQPVCSFNYGAGKYDRVRKAFFFCIKFCFVFLVIVSIVSAVNAEHIINLFSHGDTSVTEIGVAAFRLQCLTMPLNAFIVLSNMMTQTIRMPIRASVIAASRQGLIFIPVVLIGGAVFGLNGIMSAQPLADIFTLIISVVIMHGVLKEVK
jgi:putative MATE family efflux protein